MKEDPIKEGDLVVISRGRMHKAGVGKVVSICGGFCKVWLTSTGPQGQSWFGNVAELRRSYGTPNPRTES